MAKIKAHYPRVPHHDWDYYFWLILSIFAVVGSALLLCYCIFKCLWRKKINKCDGCRQGIQHEHKKNSRQSYTIPLPYHAPTPTSTPAPAYVPPFQSVHQSNVIHGQSLPSTPNNGLFPKKSDNIKANGHVIGIVNVRGPFVNNPFDENANVHPIGARTPSDGVQVQPKLTNNDSNVLSKPKKAKSDEGNVQNGPNMPKEDPIKVEVVNECKDDPDVVFLFGKKYHMGDVSELDVEDLPDSRSDSSSQFEDALSQLETVEEEEKGCDKLSVLDESTLKRPKEAPTKPPRQSLPFNILTIVNTSTDSSFPLLDDFPTSDLESTISDLEFNPDKTPEEETILDEDLIPDQFPAGTVNLAVEECMDGLSFDESNLSGYNCPGNLSIQMTWVDVSESDFSMRDSTKDMIDSGIQVDGATTKSDVDKQGDMDVSSDLDVNEIAASSSDSASISSVTRRNYENSATLDASALHEVNLD